MKTLDVVAIVLVIVGAINWGLVGLFNFNLVYFIFGTSFLANLVYVLVGAAGVWEAVAWRTMPNRWNRTAMA
jgi:uncharacterized protein